MSGTCLLTIKWWHRPEYRSCRSPPCYTNTVWVQYSNSKVCVCSAIKEVVRKRRKNIQTPKPHTQKEGVPWRKYRTNTDKVLSLFPVFTLEVHLKTLSKDLRFYSLSGHRCLTSHCKPRTARALEHFPAALAKLRGNRLGHKRLICGILSMGILSIRSSEPQHSRKGLQLELFLTELQITQ